jgi:hypothetical protein
MCRLRFQEITFLNGGKIYGSQALIFETKEIIVFPDHRKDR